MTPPPTIPTKDPALIATFYGPRGELTPLIEWLQNGLGLTDGQRPDILTFCRLLQPAAAHDTDVVEVAISTTGDTAEAMWPAFCARLQRVLDEARKIEHIWGYKLIYQAVVTEEGWLSEAQLEEEATQEGLRRLFAHARRLHDGNDSNDSDVTYPLATSNVGSGHLWLTHLPLTEDGFNAATVYVALCSAASEDAFIEEVLLGVNARLLMPDLIAHKAYHQRRQYRQGNLKERIEQAADHMQGTTMSLLSSDSTQFNHQAQLQQLTHDYYQFYPVVLSLNELHISLQRHQHNFELWQPRSELGDINQFHHSHLITTLEELHLLINKSQNTLDAAKSTVEALQTQLHDAQATRQQHIETLLAFVGTAFAITQILDRDFTSAILAQMNIATNTETDVFFLGTMQIVITLLLTGLIWLWIRRRLQRGRK